MIIDSQQVRKVAKLARLEVTPAEEEQLATQLNSILEYFEQLSELDTDSVLPTTRAIELSNVTRVDHQQVYTERDALLEQAPRSEGDFFRVPQILATDESTD